MNNSNKILFKADDDGFAKDLNKTVKNTFTRNDIKSAVHFLWFKLFFYLSCFMLSVFVLY